MFYRSPDKSVCADVIPFFENGEYKLFYLRDYRDFDKHGEGCPWCLLTTKDLVHYVDHGPVLLRGNVNEQDLYVFTGSVIKHNGKYYIFYTGHNPHLRKKGLPEQKILLAESLDLLHWNKVKDFVFEATDKYEIHDWRDPFVFEDKDNNRFCMLLAARLKNDDPVDTKGVTLLATSKDLLHWVVEDEPFYSPHAYFTHECPDLFQIGKYWYLVFSEFTDKCLTTYRISESPFGPWRCPKVNSFDGHAFYAAKSTSDGKRIVMFGWNPIKYEEKDCNGWQWGGHIIPHELVQDETDGTLFVKCPQEVIDSYHDELSLSPTQIVGNSCIRKDEIIMNNEGNIIVSLGNLPQHARISAEFITYDDIGDFGFIIREQRNFENYYKVKFEPKMNRLGFDRHPRFDGNFHTSVDVERYCPISSGITNTIEIIVEGSVLEVFMNNKIAMSARMFDFADGNFAIYAHNQKVTFKNIKLFE